MILQDEKPWVFTISDLSLKTRRFHLICMAILSFCTVAHFIPEFDNPIISFLKIAAAAASLGVLPGMALLFWLRPSPISLSECLGLSLIWSFVLIEISTVAAILLHVPFYFFSWLILGFSFAGFVACLKRSSRGTISVEKEEILLLALLFVTAALFYLRGNPPFGENFLHVSIVRRLAHLPNPSLDNISYSPSIPPTYAFPGIHAFMAMASRLAYLDPLFVYGKLRFFWCFFAQLFLYLAARQISGSRSMALTVSITGFIFVLNGQFADVGGISWAQLAPFSHPSDVAGGVFLPALLILFFMFLGSDSKPENKFYFYSTVGLMAALTLIHIREMVQFVIYIGSYVAALILFNKREDLKRARWILGSAVLIIGIYALWCKHQTNYIMQLDHVRKAELLEMIQKFNFWNYFAPPFEWMESFLKLLKHLFYGWNPVIFFAGPVLFLFYRQQRWLLMIAASSFAFFLILRIPLFTIPFVLLTYFEILYVPIRNLAFFNHLLVGLLFYSMTIFLAKSMKILPAITIAVLLSVLLYFANKRASIFFLGHTEAFFVPLLTAYALCFLAAKFYGDNLDVKLQGLLSEHPKNLKWPWVFALMIGTLLPLSAIRSSSALNFQKTNFSLTPGGLLRDFACIPLRDYIANPHPEKYAIPWERGACAPNEALMRWAEQNLPPDSVLAFNSFSSYVPSAFFPVQLIAWPVGDNANLYEEDMFPEFYKFYNAAIIRITTQPFFNTKENNRQRLEFLKGLPVTHVLVDPMYHGELSPILEKESAVLQRLYDDGEWSVYRVNRDALALR